MSPMLNNAARVMSWCRPIWTVDTQTYVGPGTTFPPMPNPPPGFVVHITVDRVGGMGPWSG